MKALHSTSWGRIYMMLRADLTSNKRTLITLVLSLITLTYCLPRLAILTSGSYTLFIEGWVESYKLVVVDYLMLLTTAIYFWVYVNRRIVHSQPTLFSTLPARLWEKLVSILLYALVLSLLAQVAARLEFLIEYLTVPNMPWAKGFASIDLFLLFPDGTIKEVITSVMELNQEQEIPVYWWVMIIAAMVGTWFSLQSTLFVAMIYIRNAFVAFFVHFIVALQLSSLYGGLVLGNISSSFVGTEPPTTGQITTFLISLNAYLWGLTLLSIYLSYRKLRRIPS